MKTPFISHVFPSSQLIRAFAFLCSQLKPVQDVRIPCQHDRMFGFLTFAHPTTVKQILAKGNLHLVCGARVLVKPFREKFKLVEGLVRAYLYSYALFE